MQPTPPMVGIRPPVSIAGAGTYLVAHDRIGPRVLELLESSFDPAAVEMLDLGNAGLALLDHLHGQDLLVVIDACALGGEPGQIHELDESSLAGSFAGLSSAHQIGPLETLAIARLLFPSQVPHRTVLFLVESGELDAVGREAVCRDVARRIELRVSVLLEDPASQ